MEEFDEAGEKEKIVRTKAKISTTENNLDGVFMLTPSRKEFMISIGSIPGKKVKPERKTMSII